MIWGMRFRPIRALYVASHRLEGPPEQVTDLRQRPLTWKWHVDPRDNLSEEVGRAWPQAQDGRPAPVSRGPTTSKFWLGSSSLVENVGSRRLTFCNTVWRPMASSYKYESGVKNWDTPHLATHPLLHLELESSLPRCLRLSRGVGKYEESEEESGSAGLVGTLLRLYLDEYLSIIVSIRVFLYSSVICFRLSSRS